MRTPLRDMAPWRRRLVANGLPYVWLASRTGKSVDTVKAYASGQRRTPSVWVVAAEAALDEYERTAA